MHLVSMHQVWYVFVNWKSIYFCYLFDDDFIVKVIYISGSIQFAGTISSILVQLSKCSINEYKKWTLMPGIDIQFESETLSWVGSESLHLSFRKHMLFRILYPNSHPTYICEFVQEYFNEQHVYTMIKIKTAWISLVVPPLFL